MHFIQTWAVKGIYCTHPACKRSLALSHKLNLPMVSVSTFKQCKELYLTFDNDILKLSWGGASNSGETPFFIDFLTTEQSRRQKQARSELVVKAVGKIPSTASYVWDLTAGLGRDSVLLHAGGWNVTMFERNKILSSLLEDGLNRFICVKGNLINTINLVGMEANEWYQSLSDIDRLASQKPAVVYLDPMYSPDTIGKKALVKKDMQMLHRVLGVEEGLDESNNNFLFNYARAIALNRIVVKRALTAPTLVNSVPHESITGTSQRFDIYFQNRPIQFKK